MVLLVIILVVTLALLISQKVRMEVVALLAIASLGFSGILPLAEVLSGFSNQATITVAAMLILSAGLERAGVVDFLGALLARRARGGVSRMLLVLGLPTAFFSAFMNNTAIVALMMPVALTASRRLARPPSRFLLPLSYLSILGGTCTLVGTSTSILVDSLYRDAGGPGFGMFEFSALGLVYLAFAGAYVVLIAPRLLPDRTSLAQIMTADDVGQFVTEVVVPEQSITIGRSIADVFGRDRDVRVLELVRNEEAVLGPALETAVEANDTFLVEGTARRIHELLDGRRLVPGTAVSDEERLTISRIDLRMVEAVVTPGSRFMHQKIRDLGLNRRHGVRVLALRRLGRHHQFKLREFNLHSGDVLLLQGERLALDALQEEGDLLLIEGVERGLTFPRKAPLAAAILVAVVALAAFGAAPIGILAIAGVAAMLLTGCLSMARATRALDPSVLLLLAGMIPMGLAMERTGLAGWIVEAFVAISADRGPVFLIAAFYLLTSILTEFLSNNATAVLLTPICIALAAKLGIDPKPLLVAVIFGSSASFATPIGYQTNTMVMGPGGYRFGDYLKVGIPLNVLTWILAVLLIPVFWPMH